MVALQFLFTLTLLLTVELTTHLKVHQVTAFSVIVSEPQDHGRVRFERINQRGDTWECLLQKLISSQNLVHGNSDLGVLRQTFMVNTLADDQEPKCLNHEPNEVSEVVLCLPVVFLEVEYFLVDTE
jgi:hypothetical protein